MTKIFTVVQLAGSTTLERACQLANIEVAEVNLVQTFGDDLPSLPNDFRIVVFDGKWMRISETFDATSSVKCFPVSSVLQVESNRAQHGGARLFHINPIPDLDSNR